MEVLLGGGGGGGAEVALLLERLQRRMRGFAVEEQRLDTALPRFQVLPDMRSHQPLSCPIGPMAGMSWFWYPQLEQIHPLHEVLQVKRELVLNYFKIKYVARGRRTCKFYVLHMVLPSSPAVVSGQPPPHPVECLYRSLSHTVAQASVALHVKPTAHGPTNGVKVPLFNLAQHSQG